jgi:hypothetical protein
MVRTTLIPQNKTVSFNIPENYVGKELTVIAFSNDEGLINIQKDKKVSFIALEIDTKGFKLNRDEGNER